MAVKIGIIGMGGMGGLHFNSCGGIPGAKVTAICDINPEKLKNRKPIGINIDVGASKEMNVSDLETYEDYKEMVKKADIDVVVITTPTYLHAEMALAAFKAGKHVFSEKPIARTSALARKAAAAAAKAGKFYMIGHVLRFFPEYEYLKGAIDSGQYGKLRSALFFRNGGSPSWSGDSWYVKTPLSGHAALDLHIHDVDTIQWLFGMPGKVSSHGSVTDDGGVDYIWTQYSYDGRGVIMAEGGWVPGAMPFEMGFRVAFETAAIEYKLSAKPAVSLYVGGQAAAQHPDIKPANGYQVELKYFLDCVAAGKKPDRATPDDAARSVAIVEAELKSILAGRPVVVKS